MNLVKKMLAGFAMIIIIVGAIGIGAYYNGYLDGFLGGIFDRFTRVDVPESAFHYDLVEPEEAEHEVTLIYDENTEYTMEKYYELLKDTNAAYLWEGELVAGEGDWFEHHVESISKEEFNERMKNVDMTEENKRETHPSYNADSIRAMVEGIIQSLTKPSKSIKISFPGKTTMIVGYNGGSKIECFNNREVGSEGEEKFFSKEKLSLQCDNIEVGTILCGEDLMKFGPNFIVKVSADVTCKKNKGGLANVSWIPDQGSTKKVEFLISFLEWNPGSYYLPIIDDIRVIS